MSPASRVGTLWAPSAGCCQAQGNRIVPCGGAGWLAPTATVTGVALVSVLAVVRLRGAITALIVLTCGVAGPVAASRSRMAALVQRGLVAGAVRSTWRWQVAVDALAAVWCAGVPVRPGDCLPSGGVTAAVGSGVEMRRPGFGVARLRGINETAVRIGYRA